MLKIARGKEDKKRRGKVVDSMEELQFQRGLNTE